MLRLRACLGLLLLAACASPANDASDDGASADDAVTAIDDTSIKEQTIGTCWLYTTAAWAESLHLEATHETVDLSETYWTYWALYDRIVNGKIDANGFIDESGTWGEAADIISRYGMMREADFIPEDANDPNTDRAEDALNAILTSLAAGKLTTSAARHDRALIRSELNAAFGLKPNVAAWLDASFGADGRRVLNAGGSIAAGAPIIAATDFQVTAGPGKTRPLSALIGIDLPNIDPNRRTGVDTWQYAQYPRGTDAASKRSLMKRVQRALNDRLPVVIAWRVDHAAVGPDGTLKAPTGRQVPTESHLSLITDYQVSNVPGFGTLPVGETESRAAALTASLADTAVVDLLRIKNSWGNEPRQHSAIPPGYYDIARGYYDASFDICSDGSCLPSPAFNYVILPAGY